MARCLECGEKATKAVRLGSADSQEYVEFYVCDKHAEGIKPDAKR